MPAPTTADEFFELVRKSAVVEEARFNNYVQKLRSDGLPTELNALAGKFVQDGYLTYFQAEQFLQGRWKRFNIGKYRVLEKIGSGGMGQVYLCEHKLMRRRVAVKVLPVNKAADESSRERFYREARAVAALDHQNIVRAYDIDQDDNLHFLVMEYVDGSSMQEIIRKTGPMNAIRACHYVYWSAVGLQHAHENGLIHRDIKPGNILVDRQGIVKILDLGLARFFNDDQDLLTKKFDENVLGTADYLAPEQAIDSHSVDGRADIYSLGATFYFLLTGHPPFTDGTVAQKLLWHQTRQPKQVREERPDVPVEVAAILSKMMAKAAEDRYQTPTELAAALLPFTQTPIPLPVAAEMPQLSVAAMGTGGLTMTITSPSSVRTMTSAPRTPSAIIGPQPPIPTASSVGPAKATGDADTRRTAPVPVVEPVAEATDHPATPNWAVISADTANATRDDTSRRKKDGKSTRRVNPTPEVEAPTPTKSPSVRVAPKASSKLPLILGAIGAIVLLGAAAAGIYFFVLRDKTPSKDDKVVQEGNRQLLLGKTKNGPLSFTKFSEAADAAKPGDTIVLQDDEWEEAGALTRAKGLTIKAAEGKKVVWRLPAKSSASAVLTIANCEGLRIQEITFHAGNSAEFALRVSGRCPGMTIENVEFTNAVTAGLVFHEAHAEDGKPIMVKQCRVQGGGDKPLRSGVLFTNSPAPKGSLGLPNLFVTVRDSVVLGPTNVAGFEFEGSCKNVEIRNCRVFETNEGVFFKRPRADVFWQVTIANNTFANLKGAGVRCEDGSPMRKPDNRIVVDQNLFGPMPMAARVDGDMKDAKFLAANGNFRKAGVAPGSEQLFKTAEVPVDLPSNPADAKFLYYTKDHALNKAHQGKPVGATE